MKRVQKPIRLYVLAIFIVVAYGLMPFVSVMPVGRDFFLFGLWNLPLNVSIFVLWDSDGNAPPFMIIVVCLALCVFSAASAVWAFYDSRVGRIATLTFVSLDVLWWTILVIVAILESESPGSQALQLVIQPIPPLFWLAFIWWNFTRADVNAYYAYQASREE